MLNHADSPIIVVKLNATSKREQKEHHVEEKEFRVGAQMPTERNKTLMRKREFYVSQINTDPERVLLMMASDKCTRGNAECSTADKTEASSKMP